MKKVFYTLLLSLSLLFTAQIHAAITVNSPNSGESYLGCTVQEITWTATFPTSYVNIYYSIDGGKIWKPIVKSLSYYPSKYSWTVPQINSSQCLIKVTDYYNIDTDYDISDVPFSITSSSNSSLTLTSPVGGEKWGTASEKLITWNKTGSIAKVRIKYSADNGQNWTTVDTSAENTGSYAWILPIYNPNSNYLVRISDYANDCIFDESKSAFTVTDEANLTLTAPKVGEKIFASSIKKILWVSNGSATTAPAYVSLDYSLDLGATWQKISVAESNYGGFDWLVPNIVSDKCLIRIRSYTNGQVSDVTNAAFSIVKPSIAVLQPTAGTDLIGCSKTQINWTSSGTSPYVNIYYSTDNGLTWNQVANSVLNFSGNNTYTWTTPEVNSDKYIIRVADVYTPTITGHSSNFKVSKGGFATLKIVSPNGGDSLKTGARVNLAWTSNAVSNKVNIQYSGDGGISWSSVATVANTGKYLWTVPPTASSKSLIKITDIQNECIVDMSDAFFAIVPAPFINISFPNAASDTLYPSNTKTITWTSGNVAAYLNISYSTDSGATWTVITSFASNNGAYSWTLPNIYSTKCLVKVASGSELDGYVSDVSDAVFTIGKPTFKITSPNSGETVNGCSATNISWTSKGGSSAVYVYYSPDLGTTWNLVNTNTFSNKEGNNSCPWTPPGLLADNCLIKVVDYSNPVASDVSDNAFSIVKTDTAFIKITYPNGAETFGSSRRENITWTTSGKVSNVNIKYSTDGGANWTNISTYAPNTGSYSWLVPNTVSSKYVISITDYNNACNSDLTDKPFSVIAVPTFTLYNYATVLLSGNTTTLSWSKVNLDSAVVKLEYSTDSAKTWKLIATNLKNVSSYVWTIPKESSSKCFAKISLVSNADIFDITDAVFTIAQPSLKLTAPAAGASILGCSTATIKWSGRSPSGSVLVYYSVDGGKYWSYITNAMSSALENSCGWNTAGIASTTCRIKIVDPLNTTFGDSSTSNFTITHTGSTLKLTSPVDNEIHTTGSIKKITWTSSGTIGNLELKYSHNGQGWVDIVGIPNTMPNTGSYLWAVPNIPSDNFRLAINDATQTCITDFTDQKFVIKEVPHILVNWDKNYNMIRWTSNALGTSAVNIEFSADSMKTWSMAATNEPNDGSYGYLPPNLNSSKCYFRVSQVGNATLNGVNPAPIEFTKYFTFTSPLAGETWTGCATKAITWTSKGYYQVKIQSSVDNGVSWSTIGTANSYQGSNSFSWSPFGVNSDKCLLRLVYGSTPQITETSALFSIQYSGAALKLQKPNGGESFGTSSQQDITWTTTGTVPTISLTVSDDGGLNWNNLSFYSTNTGKYKWAVPNKVSADYLIKISDNTNCIYDISDAKFSVVSAPNITVTSPTAGDQLNASSSYSINWQSSQPGTDFVTIDYSLDGGTTWSLISAKTENYGYANWKTPDVASTKALVRVRDFANPSLFDVSDSLFTLLKQNITITSPLAAQNLVGCSTHKITWSYFGPYYFNLYYSTDGGASWSTIATSVYTSSYDWKVPSASATNCLLKIESGSDAGIFDISDQPFTISNPGTASLKLISPNGGELYKAGTDKTIIWTTTGTVSSVALKYSADAGSTWTNIASPSNTGSYQWRLPAVTATKYLVTVTDASNACITDKSDAEFSIQSIPTIAVTSPKSKDTLYSFSSYGVSVSRSNDVPNYILELSTDSLRTWTKISTPYFDPYATWKAPDLVSHNCFIRASYGNAYGISTKFSIVKPVVNITTPAGGEEWLGCSYHDIRWFCKGTTGNVDIFYTIDNGSTWKLIASNVYTVNGNNYYSWTLPAIMSKSCRVKVVSTASGTSGISAAPFIVNNGLKSLEVVSPIGGENLATGTSKTILWESTGGIAKVDLKYSADGGNSWNNVAYNINNTGTYNWTVPANVSTTSLIRVSDNTNTCVFDQSNFAFNITPALTLLYPNGGEKLKGCQTTNISWTSQGSSSYVNLSYSIDGGTTWNNIVNAKSNLTGNNSYAWNVAGINTQNCLIKVVDYYNTAVGDVSDAKCSIESSGISTLTITSPNGGESWGTGKQKLITWTGVNVSNKVNVDYSPDGGANWSNLATGYTNTGAYDWRLPGTVTSKYLVRVTDYANSCVTDQSDVAFNVIPMSFITINSLNTYEKIYASKYKTLYWSSGSLKSINLTLEYSTDSMKTWKSITGGYNFGGQFDWYVPNAPSEKCFIKIYDSNDPATFDINNAAFAIASPNITLTAPNGGENWAACSEQKIEWTSEQASSKVSISHSTDNGVSWSTIASNINNYTYNTFTWQVPNTTTGQHKIRIQDNSNTTLNDISQTSFVISNNPSTLTLTSPNGGEILKGNESKTITWTNTGTVSSVRLKYSKDNGATWLSIGTAIPNTGSYSWTVPNTGSSTTALVQIADNGGCATDQSNAAFTIQATPILSVYNPYAGQTFGIGTLSYIFWHAENMPSAYVNIDYTTDNGATWKSIATQYAGSEYAWLIPNTPSNLCRVRISDFSNPSVQVISNGTFNIVPAGINLLSPNGGELLSSCTDVTIAWTNTLTDMSTLFFSADNGATWSKIASFDKQSGNSNGYYIWKVPTISATQCLIKVTSYSDTTVKDVSNSTFTIQNSYSPTLKVTSPNGGENWAGGSTQQITWTSDASVKSVHLKYSSDNGTSWIFIARNVNNSGSYMWTVPSNVSSAKTLISITDVDNSCNVDISNALFNITGVSSITVLTPNGGEKLSAGANLTISWEAAFLVGAVKLEYSINNGSTWNLIADTLKNDGSYIWLTPPLNSTVCLIRASDASKASVFDLSNAPFSIEPAKLRVTRPNGGESWYGNTVKSVFWSATNLGTSFVKLEYSLDSAKTWKLIAEKEANDGSYAWTLPNSGSINCYLKVSDFNNPAVYDMNDTVFTMIKPAFTILTPNGGETLKACTFTTVTWTGNSSGNLYYSTDGGTTWTSFPGGLNGNYSSGWKVPDLSSNKCLVKIVDANDPTLFDISDALFTITNARPALALTSPNGGETWGTGQKKNITWTAAADVKFVKLEVAIGNSYNYSSILTDRQIANTGSAEWTVYNYPGIAYIRISDEGSCASDVSNAAFTIQAAPFIAVTSPDDVHQWTAGTYHEIQWNSGNLNNGKVNLHYSIDGGNSWILIASDVQGNSYNWTVPYNYTEKCVIKVSDAVNASVFATSNYLFKISKPTFSYLATSNGKELSACMRTEIYWNTTSASVNLYYSADSGATWKSIAKNVGYSPYPWTVPQENSEKCFLKVADAGDETAYDIGDLMFRIDNPVRSVTLTNTFEQAATGSLKNITWTSTGSFYAALLEYSTDGGANWQLIKEVWNSGSYKWRIPNEPSLNALFRISDKTSCATDQSETFKIEAVPYIYVTSPEVPENWDAGSIRSIYWNTGNLSDQTVNLYYSIDSGKVWTKIGTSNTGGFNWTVPYVASSKVFVKVSAALNAAVYGINEHAFTISKPSITIKYPNGGEKLTACVNHSITWESNGVTSVYLYYSTDNGLSWTRIYSNPTYDRNYSNWVLPELSSSNALIKIVDANDPLVSDISDANFQIQNINTTATLKLLSPNGGEVWNTYSQQELKWSSTGAIKNVTLMYATYGGLNWEYIATVPNTGSYLWKVPNTPTLSGIVKVIDANSCVSDVNDNQFDIKTVPFIQIQSPQGGEDLSQSTSVYVGGTAANLSSDYVKLEYSVDAGKTWIFITENISRNYGSFYYYWTVPSVLSATCLLRASDPLDPTTFHVSDVFSISPASTVWPGDIDNNGVADVYDMLFIGLNFNITGLPRAVVSTDWAPQNALNWNKPQSNGLDLKFSDCDGDGIVYYQDTLAIVKNYGLMHTNTNNLRIASPDAELYFIMQQATAADDTLRAEIWAGTSTDPINDLYGIAFNISFDGAAVEPNSARLSFNKSWLGNLGTQAIALQKAFTTLGRIDGAVVRTDKTSKTGYGKIADLKLKLKKDVELFELDFSGQKAVAVDGKQIILAPKGETVVTIPTGTREWTSSLAAELYPNPSTGEVFVAVSATGSVDVTVTNIIGTTAWKGTTETGSLRLELSDLPKGTYLVKLEHENGSVIKKLVLQ